MLRTRRTGNPGGDPHGTIVAVFDDGAVLRLRYCPDASAVEPLRRSYGYRITRSPAAGVDAGQVCSGMGEDIDLPRALAALTSFLLADAERYDYAGRCGGLHPDGEPVTGVHKWASQHTDELQELELELSVLPPGSVDPARVAPLQAAGTLDGSGDRPGRGEPPYRIVVVSVRGDHYFIVGAAGCFDLDQVPPAGVGQTFGSTEGAQAVVRRKFARTTSLWQFRIIDVTGATVATGFRSGPNGTGATIQWDR